MQTKRQEECCGVHKPAVVSHPGAPARKCVIIDFGAAGARLRFASPADVPDALKLAIPGDNLVLDVSVSWRDERECGVDFKQRIAHPLLTKRRMQQAARNVNYA